MHPRDGVGGVRRGRMVRARRRTVPRFAVPALLALYFAAALCFGFAMRVQLITNWTTASCSTRRCGM